MFHILVGLLLVLCSISYVCRLMNIDSKLPLLIILFVTLSTVKSGMFACSNVSLNALVSTRNMPIISLIRNLQPKLIPHSIIFRSCVLISASCLTVVIPSVANMSNIEHLISIFLNSPRGKAHKKLSSLSSSTMLLSRFHTCLSCSYPIRLLMNSDSNPCGSLFDMCTYRAYVIYIPCNRHPSTIYAECLECKLVPQSM